LSNVLEKYKETNNPIILKHIISSFQPALISLNAKTLVDLIKESDQTFSKAQLLSSLGVSFLLSPPSTDYQLPLLKEVWQIATTMVNPKEYITVADVFIEYAAKYCTPREVNTYLGDIVTHMKEAQAYEQLQTQLQSIVLKVIHHYQNFSIIFSMDNFLALLDLFLGPVQIELNRSILDAFCKYQYETLSDPLIISTIFSVGKTVHDSLNTLSFQDDVRQISKAIASFIAKLDFDTDLEQHLSFFVDCRRAYSNLDHVKYRLTIGTCNLAMRTFHIVKGKHTRKTSAFVRACISYCFITIPSMEDHIARLKLYILTGSVALINHALSQADALLRSFIKLIPEVPLKIEIDSQMKSSDTLLCEVILSFLGLLVAVPGHPEQGPFYLTKALLTVVADYTWEKGSVSKAKIFMNVLSLLSCFTQPNLPYRFRGVETNDELFAGDPDYANELQSMINKVLEQLLEELTNLSQAAGNDTNLQQTQAKVVLDLFNFLLSFSQLNSKSATLAVQLFQLAKKHLSSSPYLINSLNRLKNKEGALMNELCKKLSAL